MMAFTIVQVQQVRNFASCTPFSSRPTLHLTAISPRNLRSVFNLKPYHHRVCHSLSTRASSRSPHRSPVLSPLEHHLEQCRTATLSATSLSFPPPICAPSCEHQWHSSPHSHLPTTPLFVLLLDVRRVFFPALSETVNCRATSPRLVQFADTTLPFDGNSHDRVVSCCIFLTMSSRYLIVCSLHSRLASSCRWCRWWRWCWSSNTVGSR